MSIIYSFVKFGCAICIFLSYENLMCGNTDISKCFRESLQLRDNESRLYITRNLRSRYDEYSSIEDALAYLAASVSMKIEKNDGQALNSDLLL